MKFLFGIVTGILIVAGAAVFVIASGRFPVAATNPPSDLEKAVATLAVRRSVARLAPRDGESGQGDARNARESDSRTIARCA